MVSEHSYIQALTASDAENSAINEKPMVLALVEKADNDQANIS